MKKVAIIANLVLVAVASLFATTSCTFYFHRPETPAELLNK
ncbi:cyclic lactone autoinducer peptide [Paenibacillus turpanensis]|nr:cyclic lactone autoinducer peptide [Paenibacillus turpanensis]